MLVSACKCWMSRKRPRLWDCSWISNKGVHHNWTVCEGKVFSKHVCIYIKHSISKLSSITRRKFICYFADFLILQLMMMRTCAIFFRLCDWRLGARRAREDKPRSIPSAIMGTIYVACESSRRIDTAWSLSNNWRSNYVWGKQIINRESEQTSLDRHSKKFPLRNYNFRGEQ